MLMHPVIDFQETSSLLLFLIPLLLFPCQCGNTVEAQFALFNNIKPLFSNKPLIVVVNKIDVKKVEDLSDERKAFFEDLKKVKLYD